jgi:hypothetical protein
MITDGLLYAISWLLASVVGLIPDFVLPEFMSAAAIDGAFDQIREWVEPWAYWIDVPTISAAAAAAIYIRVALFAYLTGTRVIALVRGSS